MNGTQRIQDHFHAQKAFVAYLTAGDGGIQRTLDAALALIAGGVNMLEIGVPFSDPIADGPVIQRAATRALMAKTTLKDVLWLAQQIRQYSTIPLILFSYLNPILAAMKGAFFQEAQDAGIDGALLVDCPLEESVHFHEQCNNHHLAPIYVITPTTSTRRIQDIDAQGNGFLYYACRKGTTGIKSDLPSDFADNMQRIKSVAHLPIVAGFGISTPQSAAAVCQHADGVVIGSLFVKALEEGMTLQALTALAQRLNPIV